MRFHRGQLCIGLLMIGLVCVMASGAFAQNIRKTGYRTDLDWSPRKPDSGRVGGCYGNCGRGCSGRLNLGCRTGRQYWEKRIIGPVKSERVPITECRVDENMQGSDDEGVIIVHGEEYTGTVVRYTSRGRWMFHGFTARLCQEHDYFCRTRGGCGKASLEDHLRPLFRRIGGCTGLRSERWWYEQTFTAWGGRRVTPSGRTCTAER